ncbi:MAG: NADH-quinone oxidoreductase subunit NuoE [Fidelibacterota bacterium]
MTASRGEGKAFAFEDPSAVEEILSRYPDRRSATLPLLHLAQSEKGYISREVIEAVAGIVEVHPAEIADVVSFYTLFYREPPGRTQIQTLPCSLSGADHLVDHACRKLGIRPGGTTSDGKITLRKVECLGSCGTAPVVQVNSDYHEGMTLEEFDSLLDSLS